VWSVNWSYIAAFLDGEGSILYSISSSTGYIEAPRLVWNQEEENDMVLYAIREFLEKRDIRCSLDTSSAYTKLRVNNREGVRRALGRMLPHLWVKREKAVECIRLIDQKTDAMKFHGVRRLTRNHRAA
jgi:hypothetical protein